MGIAVLYMASRLNFGNMLTQIAQAITCMIIKAIAVGQFALGMADRAKPISGRRLINRKMKAMI